MDLSGKKIFISPHTPKSTMLEKQLKKKFQNINIIGYIDKQKVSENIFKIEDVNKKDFDYIIIYSPNHFFNIYEEYSKLVDKQKLLNIQEKTNKYIINDEKKISKLILQNESELFRLKVLDKLVKINDEEKIKRQKIVFLSKEFIGTNNKALLIECLQSKLDVCVVSDNISQLGELSLLGIKCYDLNSLDSCFILANAKIVIQDQGNSNNISKLLSKNQITIQLWHGIPLKRMNRLVDVIYSYHISTSSYVNQTSLQDVISAKKHLDLGYPRNDLLLKEHKYEDLCFVDKEIYNLANKERVIVYMPTHREAAFSFDDDYSFSLDLKRIDELMKRVKSFFILKLHPFVASLFEKESFSNILIYPSQSDIYPVLKYTDILITDYSSVYFDFLFVDKPIIFYDYDYEEYSSNMQGFVYSYGKNTPGKRVNNQEILEQEVEKILEEGKDNFKNERNDVLNKFFTYKDEFSSKRIIEELIPKEFE